MLYVMGGKQEVSLLLTLENTVSWVCVGMLLEREGDEAGSAGWRFIATRSSLYVCRNSSSSRLNAYSVFIWIGKIQKGALKYSRCRARSAAQAVFLWSFWFFSCLDATVD